MRRTRNRYYTIDAENEEEFIKEYENMRKSRLTQMEFKDKESDQDKIQETEEEDQLSPRKNKAQLNDNDTEEDGEYSGLGVLKDLDDDEDDLGPQYDDVDEIIKESEDEIIKNDNSEEKGIEILCYYLKNSINEQSKGKLSNNTEAIFYKNKNSIRALSGNAIYDLNIRDLVDNILTENDNEYTKSNEGNNNSLKDYIFQNIESDSNLKIMVMSNNKSTKNSFINKFFGKNSADTEDNKTENLDEPFEIRKKQIKLFNKNITLQIFDTSDEFHKNSISYVYYKAVTAFFIFIEASNHNVQDYLKFILGKLNKYIINKTCVIFGINMLFKEDCTIDDLNLREYASDKNMMFIPIKINDFDLNNSLVINLLNLILIKGIDNNSSKTSLRKESKAKRLGKFKSKLTNKINDSSKKNLYDITKMNIPSSLGYKKKYRIKHINVFDMDDSSHPKYKRKLSVDI